MSTKPVKFKRLKEYDTIWHPDSTLVFKSATEKIVVGRFVDGEMIKLDETALEISKEWKFKYDETLLKNEDEEDENEEDENENEDDENEDEVEESEEVVVGEEEEENGEEETIKEKVEEEKEEILVKEKRKEEVPLTKVEESEDFSIKFVFLNKYLNELSSSVDSHKKNSEKEIDILKDDLFNKNKEFDLLKNNYDQLEDQYTKLKAKFDGIKNFFS